MEATPRAPGGPPEDRSRDNLARARESRPRFAASWGNVSTRRLQRGSVAAAVASAVFAAVAGLSGSGGWFGVAVLAGLAAAAGGALAWWRAAGRMLLGEDPPEAIKQCGTHVLSVLRDLPTLWGGASADTLRLPTATSPATPHVAEAPIGEPHETQRLPVPAPPVTRQVVKESPAGLSRDEDDPSRAQGLSPEMLRTAASAPAQSRTGGSPDDLEQPLQVPGVSLGYRRESPDETLRIVSVQLREGLGSPGETLRMVVPALAGPLELPPEAQRRAELARQVRRRRDALQRSERLAGPVRPERPPWREPRSLWSMISALAGLVVVVVSICGLLGSRAEGAQRSRPVNLPQSSAGAPSAATATVSVAPSR